ncbi:MAG: dihydroneopterin aldolase [Alphaproteobacteria bacterium]|jgi:dihydroneopterin aldolase|nr:dihydroneopterin aldolase [Alphaproteobacteria bacterium]MDP6516707.1 dihydroneopterin aldolase [Alphaproteobacteria bacterium]
MSQAEDVQAAAQPRAWRGIERVLIEGLVLECRIGIHPHERGGTQRVRIDIALERAELPGAVDDDIRNAVCYENVIGRVRGIVADGHVNLVETLAERIADALCAELPIERLRVRVCKLDAFDHVESVGAEIERRLEPARPARAAGRLRAIAE